MNEQVQTSTPEFKEEDDESLAKIYDHLFAEFERTIKKECEGRALTVVLPTMDALGAHAINTIMMVPVEDRERFLISFVLRLKSWFEEAMNKVEDKKRIITLN